MTTKKPTKKVIPLKTLSQLKNELSLLREENMRLRFESSRGMWLSHDTLRLMLDKLNEVDFHLSGILHPFEEFHSCTLWQRIRLFFAPFACYFNDWSRCKSSARIILRSNVHMVLTRLLAASTQAKEPETNG